MLLHNTKLLGAGWLINCILALALTCASAVAAPNWIKYNAFPTPTANHYTSLTKGPNGLLWFVDYDGNSIGSLTTGGVVTEYPIPWTHYPTDLVLGPDGALWFSEVLVGIGRFDPASGFTEYPMPEAATGPGSMVELNAIAAGPDGALWFTQNGVCQATCVGPNIGRMTTSGVIAIYPLTMGPGDIIAGPDGALWFTELGDLKRIGRITTGGALTEYNVPGVNTQLSNLVLGSDGALWFIEVGLYKSASKVARITTGGVLTEFTVPSSASVKTNSSSSLVAGSDGALWFQLSKSFPPTSLWRMTTNGTFTAYPSDSLGITDLDSGTVGPDGALWFTGNQRVVRLPACGLGLGANFANSTLTLNFNGGAPTPTIWQTGFYYGTGSFQALWSVPLGPVVHSTPFTVPLGPGFPSIGNIAALSLLRDAATNDGLCAEWEIVNTGGSGGVIEEEVQGSILKRLGQ